MTFVAVGNKTELTLHLVFSSPADRDRVVHEYGAIEGGKQTLDRLMTLVEGDFMLSRLANAPREKV